MLETRYERRGSVSRCLRALDRAEVPWGRSGPLKIGTEMVRGRGEIRADLRWKVLCLLQCMCKHLY
jgi:hypothetical protein